MKNSRLFVNVEMKGKLSIKEKRLIIWLDSFSFFLCFFNKKNKYIYIHTLTTSTKVETKKKKAVGKLATIAQQGADELDFFLIFHKISPIITGNELLDHIMEMTGGGEQECRMDAVAI